MSELFSKIKTTGWLGILTAMLVMLAGCNSTGPASSGGASVNSDSSGVASVAGRLDQLQINDYVSVLFTGIPNPPDRHDERINEKGQITLNLIGTVDAAGKTPEELRQAIFEKYVPRYYKRLTVVVQTENRFFFVAGEVKNPSRLIYAGGMTVLKAIAAAGDFTDFANRNAVELRRSNGQSFTINTKKALKDPSLDLPVIPGDVITVKRRVI